MANVDHTSHARSAWDRVILLALCACGAARPVRDLEAVLPIRGLPPLVGWLGEFTRPAGAAYAGLPPDRAFSSLSGLAPDAKGTEWMAVIDERDRSRVAWFSIALTTAGVQVVPSRIVDLRPGPGVPDRTVRNADLEGTVGLPDGTFLMIEEGHLVNGVAWPPVLLHATREGLVTGVVPFPKAFAVDPAQQRGVRDNRGFEALAITPGGRVIAGLEQPLIEDGPPSSYDRGAAGRLVEFVHHTRGWRPGRQWRYLIEPTPRLAGFEVICKDGENGLVDLLGLSDTTLLALERACLMDPATQQVANTARLFAVELGRGEVRKSLVLDLGTLVPRLSPALARLENFEGLSFGPRTADGSRTLVVMSDDNNRATQKTAFLVFRIR